MHRTIKRALVLGGGLLGTAALSAAAYALVQARAFDASMQKQYAMALPTVTTSTAPEVLARGRHLTESLGGCTSRDCHGSDLSGGRTVTMGPVGTYTGPNITSGGILGVYTDGELMRLIQHGVKKDGQSVRMMPVQDFYWLPDSDVAAMISYLRSVPKADKPSGSTKVGILGKVLDRRDKFHWDIARIVEQLPQEAVPPPNPSASYGRFVVRMCTRCHGETLSGGPIPGAPPSMPTPVNITPHESGIKGYTFDDFVRVLRTGTRKDGRLLDPFMSIDLTRNLDETELKALWAELQVRPPKAFGGR